MVEDLDIVMTTEDECLMAAAGKYFEDSGCTAPVMGSKTWDAWLSMLQDKGMSEHVVEQASHKTFTFWRWTHHEGHQGRDLRRECFWPV